MKFSSKKSIFERGWNWKDFLNGSLIYLFEDAHETPIP